MMILTVKNFDKEYSYSVTSADLSIYGSTLKAKPLKSDLQEYINEQMEDGEFEKEFNKQRKRFEKIMAKIRKQK